MHLSSRTRDRAILTVLFGGGAILLIIALVLWRNSSNDADPDAPGGVSSLQDTATGALALPLQTIPIERRQALTEMLGGSLTTSTGTGAPHRVTIKARSGGNMYIGFLYRDGKGAGVFVKNRTFEITKVVRGETPAAIIAIEVLDSPSATCTIYIDGKKVRSDTAHGPGSYASCLA